MKQDDPQFKLRIPADLKHRLDEEAEKNTRTLGAEIVARLAVSFDSSQAGASSTELQHRLSAQETELELLRETGRHLQKIITSQDVSIIMLQAYLLEMINAMPKGMRSDERVKIATKFALQTEDSGKPAPYQVPLQLKDPGRPYEVGQGLVPEATPSKMSAPPKKRTAAPQKKQ